MSLRACQPVGGRGFATLATIPVDAGEEFDAATLSFCSADMEYTHTSALPCMSLVVLEIFPPLVSVTCGEVLPRLRGPY